MRKPTTPSKTFRRLSDDKLSGAAFADAAGRPIKEQRVKPIRIVLFAVFTLAHAGYTGRDTPTRVHPFSS